MTRRALWKGSIQFGDTSVPVKLHLAVREERVRFHLLHRRDGVRLHQLMICAYEKKPVPAEAQTKGFEVEEGKYLIVDPEELETMEPEASRAIEVHEFVQARQVDPLSLERVYYLEPDGILGGYGELAATLEEMDVAGVCTWIMRKRSYLGALQASGGGLRLSTLRYADEMVSVSSLGLQEIPISEKELRIGCDLIGQMTESFAPGEFENEHQRRLQELIEKKARGEKVEILRPRLLQPTAPDKLLEALEASLKKVA